MTVKKATTKATAATPAADVPFYTPGQVPPAGTVLAEDGSSVPTVFTPLTLRGLTLPNRIAVSPMCTYSADDGHLTDWHLVHYGEFALHGTALTMIEATAVTPNGRISPEDSGLWTDSQIAPIRRIADYIHSQGQKVGIQIGHAGRKASTLSPWLSGRNHIVATPEQGGWPDNIWAPSAIGWQADDIPPKAVTVEQIAELTKAFADTAVRAVKAGVDLIQIHAAHGYLLSSFLSPLSNQRTDAYGGSFENRIRLLHEVIVAIRAVIPETMPLTVRVSATEWMEYAGAPSWDEEQTLKLARTLPALGVDLLEISSGGNHPEQKIQFSTGYQTDIAGRIRAALRAEGINMAIGGVGNVATAEIAKSLVQDDETSTPKADLVSAARQFLREPQFVRNVAAELGIKVKKAVQHWAI